MTKIEWADATWNPVTGCSKVSPGCKNCYAERMAKRLAGRYGYPVDDPFRVTLHPDRLDQPLRWKTPRRVFVNSMSDLFHEDVPLEFIADVFNIMASVTPGCGKRHKHEPECWTGPRHIFQILTKRPNRMRQVIEELPHFVAEYWPGDTALSMALEFGEWPLKNVWLGVSVEDQQRADERIPLLLQTPAAVRFLSCEPLLGPIDFGRSSGCRAGCSHEHCLPFEIDWVIVGGESGPGARPMHPDWVRSIRDQCVWMEVPFFFKQWGDWREACPPDDPLWNGHPPKNLLGAHGTYFLQLGKKATGRILDGQTWDQIPGTVPPSVDYP